jgi:hypothetical protein
MYTASLYIFWVIARKLNRNSHQICLPASITQSIIEYLLFSFHLVNPIIHSEVRGNLGHVRIILGCPGNKWEAVLKNSKSSNA